MPLTALKKQAIVDAVFDDIDAAYFEDVCRKAARQVYLNGEDPAAMKAQLVATVISQAPKRLAIK